MPNNVTSRFGFSFTSVKTKDSESHLVEVGTIEDGGNVVDITLVRKIGMDRFPPLVSRVECGKEVLWDFRSAKTNNAVAELAELDGAFAVAYVGRGKDGKIEHAIGISTLLAHRQQSLNQTLALKRAIGKKLGRKVFLTRNEIELSKLESRREREAAAERRAESRKALQEEVADRGRITAYLAEGRPISGFPVLEGEWRSLPKGTHVILVDKIGGTPLEHFQVLKQPGRDPAKGYAKPVSATRGERPSMAVDATKPRRTSMFALGADAFEVSLFSSMDEIRKAREAGLNSGTYAAVDRRDEQNRYEVYSIRKDGIDTVGLFPLLT